MRRKLDAQALEQAIVAGLFLSAGGSGMKGAQRHGQTQQALPRRPIAGRSADRLRERGLDGLMQGREVGGEFGQHGRINGEGS